MSRDIVLFGLTGVQLMDRDRQNEERMVPLNTKDWGTPFEPIGPSRPVRRGATWGGCSEFILRSEERCRRLT